MKKLLVKTTRSWYFKIGLIALVLRLLLMPITFHPDFISLNSSRFYLVEKGVWNFYDFLASLSADHPLSRNYGTNYFTYPPLSYLTFGFFSFLFKPFSGQDITFSLIENYPQIFDLPGLASRLFWFKVPYLFFDFGLAYLLTRFFQKEKEKRTAFLLWLFNPVSFQASYLMGQFEIMPTFFIVLALLLAQAKKPHLAAASLGVGGAYKMFPLFFVPILAAALGKTLWQKAKLLIIGFGSFLLLIAPFLKSVAFRQVVLLSNQSQKFLFMNLPLSGAESILLFVFLWGMIFFAAWYQSVKNQLWTYFLAVMLLFFSLTHYHPQWFLWLIPLLVIQLVKTNFKFSFLSFTLLLCWLTITLLFEASLSYGLFTPLDPRLFDAPSLSVFVSRFYDVLQLKSIIRSLFAAASAMLIFSAFKNQKQAA